MKLYVTLALVLLASLAFGSVRSGTSYYSAAVDFSNGLAAVGVYPECSIEYWEGGYYYIARFDNGYYSPNDAADLVEVFYCAMCAGIVSESTSWRSIGLICVYEDDLVVMDTSACRVMNNYVTAGYSEDYIYTYFLSNSYVIERTGVLRSEFPL